MKQLLHWNFLIVSGILPIRAQVLQDNNQACKILTFIPFSDERDPPPNDPSDPNLSYYGYGTWPDNTTLAKASFSLMAAAELARHHFNSRDTSVVLELGQLGNCSITMPDPNPELGEVLYLDSSFNRKSAIRRFHDTRFLLKRLRSNGTANNGAAGEIEHLVNGRPSNMGGSIGLPTHDKDFCAFVGPVHPYVVSGMNIFAEAGRIPQIAYATMSSRFSSQSEYPFILRVLPDSIDFGAAIKKSFHDIWDREAIGILYDDSDFAADLERPIQSIFGKFDHDGISVLFHQFQDDSISNALQQIKDKGFRTIIILTDSIAVIDRVARLADKKQMVGSGYFWLLMGAALPNELLKKLTRKLDSPTDKLLRGAALFTHYDRPTYLTDDDSFLKAWKTQNVISIEKLNKLQPNDKFDNFFYVAEETYFQDEVPTEYASYIYDSIILAGISACKNFENVRTNVAGSQNITTGRKEPLFAQHIIDALQTKFHGASGLVTFKNKEYEVPCYNQTCHYKNHNSRDPSTVLFGIYNVRPGATDENNMRRYDNILTHVYSFANNTGGWIQIENASFIYYDGTNTEPMPLRDVFDPNYQSQGVQIAGLILAGVAFFLAIFSGTWVYLYRTEKLIKASQPEFLFAISFGSALVGSSSIFVAFDEGNGLTSNQLSGMCSTFPWVFVLGYLLMFCALFSKLWRLSKVMQLRRRVVRVKHVVLPCVAIMGCSVAVLIAWQILDPFVWYRKIVSHNGEPYETIGLCGSIKYGNIPFLLPIMALIIITLAATSFLSWKVRHVQSELAESSWIFGAVFLHIQTWLIGVPMLYITEEVSKDAYYIMIVVLTFTFSTSQVGFVIGPKFISFLREKYSWEKAKKTNVSIKDCSTRISGLSSPSPISFESKESSIHTPASISPLSELIEETKTKDPLSQSTFDIESFKVLTIEQEHMEFKIKLLQNEIIQLKSKILEMENTKITL